MWDKQRTNKQTLKIELLSQWKLEAEFRNIVTSHGSSERILYGLKSSQAGPLNFVRIFWFWG